MDEAGIAVQLLSGWMDLAAYHLNPEAGQWFRACRMKRWPASRSQRPDRYARSRHVPLQAPDIAADELRHAVKQLATAPCKSARASRRKDSTRQCSIRSGKRPRN